jgi:hypothetical protein
VAWRFKTDNLGARPEFNLESTPLMDNGVVYATAGSEHHPMSPHQFRPQRSSRNGVRAFALRLDITYYSCNMYNA